MGKKNVEIDTCQGSGEPKGGFADITNSAKKMGNVAIKSPAPSQSYKKLGDLKRGGKVDIRTPVK